MRNSVYFSLLLISTVSPSLQQQLDLGTCSCACGDNQRTGLPNSEPGTKRTAQGPPGKRGAAGPPGPKGDRGNPGLPGVSGQGSQAEIGSAVNPASSCSDLHDHGIRRDGVYFIRVHAETSIYQVFCDMTSPGSQGWTLVAGLHENNPNGICSIGDKWSSEYYGDTSSTGSNSWMNTNVFGDVEAVTSADYKNPAFSQLMSSNIMVWHVPNNTPLPQWKNSSSLMYYTDNDFLLEKGATLRSLFADYYPLLKVQDPELYVEHLVNNGAMSRISARIATSIPNFYAYNYDVSGENVTYISDGGNDLFDGGNKLQIQIDNGPLSSQLAYNRTFVDARGIEVLTYSGHPFIALAVYKRGNDPNSDVGRITFQLKVSSNLGADGAGIVTSYSGTINDPRNPTQYRVNHVYNANDPSCAQVFFAISDGMNNLGISTPLWESGDTQGLVDVFQVSTTNLRDMTIGYMLLSKTSARKITESEIRLAITFVRDALREASNQQPLSSSSERISPSVPVNFIKGPTGPGRFIISSDRDFETDRQIQFRKHDSYGYPRAFCPVVRNGRSEKVCWGGINTFDSRAKCGDFAGEASDAAASTSILIFYGR